LFNEHGSSAVIDWQVNLAYSLALLGDLGRCLAARRAAWDVAASDSPEGN
jgi:hypothetical protein